MADGWFGSMVAWVTDKPDVVWSGIGATVVTVVAGVVGWLFRRRKPEPAALVQPVPHNTVTGSTGTLQGVNASGNVTVTTTVGAPPLDPMEVVREYGAAKEAKARAEAATLDARREAAEMAARLEATQKELAATVTALDALRRDLPAQAPGIDSALAALREGRTDEAETLFTMVLAAHEAAGREQFREAAAAARHLGSLAFLHDTNRALGAYRKAVELDPEDAEGWNRLGHLLVRIGELGEAERAYEQVLAMGERSGDKESIAIATGNLGVIHQTRGDYDLAEEFHLKALIVDEGLGRLEGMACHYGNLGLIERAKENLDKAEEFHRKSLLLAKNLGHKEGMATQYGNLGVIYLKRDDLDRAEELHGKALALDKELGNKEGMANHYGSLGVIQRRRGELDQAERFFRKALALDEELGRLEGIANHYGNLGVVFAERREFERAAVQYRKALAIFRQVGMTRQVAQTEEYLLRIGADVSAP